MTMALASDEQQRFARHLSMPEIGEAGQMRLRAAKVLVVGLGGLGSPAAFYLAAAGVGTLGLMDADRVEASNLQRQILHTAADIGRPKVDSAAEKLTALYPALRATPIGRRLTAESVEVLRDFDFVIDATDNFASKFLVADACHQTRRPYSHAGILKFHGQTMTVIPGQTACYRCVFREPPPETAGPVQGPLGMVPGVIGTLQAGEAIKHALGVGQLLTDRLLTYDALTASFRTVKLRRDPACPLCGVRTPDR